MTNKDVNTDNFDCEEEKHRKLEHAKYMREWRAKNAAKNLEYNREYAKNNKDKFKIYRKKDREKQKQARLLDPEKYKKYLKYRNVLV